jgi:hypothetical protein
MVPRNENLQAILDLLCRSVAADALRSAETERVLRIVEERLRILPDGDPAIPDPMQMPVCALLEEVLKPATPLHEAFRAIEPLLTWYRRPGRRRSIPSQPRKHDAGWAWRPGIAR